MGVNLELWNTYRTTWEAFSSQLAELQRLVESGERADRVRSARLAVEKARVAHDVARDRLAARLAPPEPEEQRVRETARLLWEFAGKPQGTAETDWFRAEQLVRSASASGAQAPTSICKSC
jgi:hypothetical protein